MRGSFFLSFSILRLRFAPYSPLKQLSDNLYGRRFKRNTEQIRAFYEDGTEIVWITKQKLNFTCGNRCFSF